MKELVVYKWFKNQLEKGISKGFTIREVYKAMNNTSDSRCLETVWSQIVKLKETGVLVTTWTIPVRYKLSVDHKSKVEKPL